MKSLLFILPALILLTTSELKQNEPCRFKGFITGTDSRRCSCCQGYVIEVNGHTYLADSIPNKKEIMGNDETAKSPIPIYLDYVHPKYCSSMRIIITCIKKR